MIIGIGCDLIDIRRIEKLLETFKDRFEKRVFTPLERQVAQAKPFPAASYAKRFAAKEAFSKALGTGMAEGLSWQDVTIESASKGKPLLKLSDNALSLLEKRLKIAQKGKIQLDLSLSDEYPYAQAFVTISWNVLDV